MELLNSIKMKKLIKKESIDKKIRKLADLIVSKYKQDIVILGGMNGSFFFMKDLIDQLNIGFEYDFIFCSSYYGHTKSSGNVDFLYPNKVDISKKNVIILEDIIDTGRTIKAIDKKIKKYNPNTVNFCSLLIRDKCVLDLDLFWTGYKIKNEFVIGYGLDYKGEYRNLKDIYELIL